MAQIKTYNEIADPAATGAIGLVQAQPAGSQITDGVLALSNIDDIAVQLVGTFTLTVTFEASNDGVTWVACKGEASHNNTSITTLTAAGLVRIKRHDLSGFKFFRLNTSAWSSVSSFALTLTTRKD
jgi:hypothetical protein